MFRRLDQLYAVAVAVCLLSLLLFLLLLLRAGKCAVVVLSVYGGIARNKWLR